MNLSFESHEIRTVERDGAMWWVAKDVCTALQIKNSRDAMSRLDKDEKDSVGLTDTLGRKHKIAIVNESGLYALILSARKESARKFQKWVTSEVLPSIRRTGRYDIRESGKPELWRDARVSFTDCLKEHGCDKPHHYSNITNRTYRHAFGATAPELRKLRGLPAKANVRRALSEDERDDIAILELASRKRIRRQNANGYYECAEAVDSSVPVLLEARRSAETPRNAAFLEALDAMRGLDEGGAA